jgi:hypothetical protein
MHKQLDSNDSCKVKILKWGGMHRCLPLLKKCRKLAFKLGYHDSCTLCKYQCPIPTISDFITHL